MRGNEQSKHGTGGRVMDDLINKITFGILATTGNDAYSCGMRNGMKWCKSLLDGEEPDFEEVPSTQPEPLTDKEQRIFLSAMSREEEVCKQVDDEWRGCREPYEDSLVRICHEITRKVKGALWGI